MCGLQAGLFIIPLIPIGCPCAGGSACRPHYQLQTGERYTVPRPCAKPPAPCLADCAVTGGSPAGQAVFVRWHPAILEAMSSGFQLPKSVLQLPPAAAGEEQRGSFARFATFSTPLKKQRDQCGLEQHTVCDRGRAGREGKKLNKNLWSGNKSKHVSDKGDSFLYCYATVSGGTSPVSACLLGSGEQLEERLMSPGGLVHCRSALGSHCTSISPPVKQGA